MKSIFIISLIAVVMCMYDKDDKVLELTSENFKSLVLESGKPTIVEFYAPWCGHCKSLAPEYKQVQDMLGEVAQVGACDLTVHKDVGTP